MNIENIIFASLLTLLAGLSTGIGALISIFKKGTDNRMLSFALGLSAGVMVYISFMELIPEAVAAMGATMTGKEAMFWTMVAFFGGIGLIALIDYLVPEDENPHEMHDMGELAHADNHHLRRTATMLALAIGIHNFPEGMASFVAALDNIEVGLPIIIAIAIHNIPEGIAVAVPIYHATGSRGKAIKYSLLSGLAEPAGALIGMSLLLPFWTPMINAICLSAVAGIMVYISFDELLPGSEKYGFHHYSIGGVVLGMFLMATTLIFL